jgi:ribose/xylose/arabinose/galactoside ABC-type transport system permease subunit
MPNAGFWGDRAFLGINNGSWAFLILAAVAAAVLKFSVYGRCVYTVGGNREAAQLAGLRVDTIDFSVYVLSGACAGFAGAIAASQLLAAAPDIGVDTGLNSIAAVVLGGAALAGGIGTISGTVLGVLLLTTIANGLGLLQVASFYQTVITGVVLLVAVGFSQLREFLHTSSFMRSKGSS